MSGKPQKGSSKSGTTKRRRSVSRRGEIGELRVRLREAEEKLRAIREAELDAVVVSGEKGEKVCPLVGAESVYRLIFETMQEAAFTVTFEGRILFCDARFGEFVKRPPELIIGHLLREFVAPHNLAAAEALLLVGQKQPVKQRLVFQSADGTELPAHISATLLNEPDRVSICVVTTDLSELERSAELIRQLRRQQEALRECEFRHRTVADNTYDFEFWIDPEGRFIYASPSCKRIYGRESAEFLADPGLRRNVVHPEDLGAFDQHVSEEHKQLAGDVEFRIVQPAGTPCWISHACQPVFDELGHYLGVRGSSRDIADRKRAEEALRQANAGLERRVQERTRELRRLSSGLLTAQEEERRRISKELHDELGQALTLVKMRIGMIATGLGEHQEASKEHCQSASSQISQLIEIGRRLSRDLCPAALEDLGITPVIRRLATDTSEASNIRISVDFDEIDDLLAPQSLILIYRVFQESLTNIARHSRATEAVLSAKPEDRQVLFEVHDNGQGIDFDEVESAKQTARGGLGLTMMKERVRTLGGSLEIWSQRGMGTRLKFAIPTAKQGDP